MNPEAEEGYSAEERSTGLNSIHAAGCESLNSLPDGSRKGVGEDVFFTPPSSVALDHQDRVDDSVGGSEAERTVGLRWAKVLALRRIPECCPLN